LKRTKPGFGVVLDALRTARPKQDKTLGLSSDLLQKIEEACANIIKLEAARSELAKLLEVVEGRRARARLFYHAQIADKAVATRRSNAESGVDAEETTAPRRTGQGFDRELFGGGC
jgi:hypothetical protein